MKINHNILKLEINKAIEKNFRQNAVELAQNRFEEAKEAFLDKFLDDDVTKEIEGGIDEQSSILGVPGSLFAFIGFKAGDQPIKVLYDFLVNNIKMNKTPTYNKAKSAFEFTVKIPDKESIANITPMPWGTARSWVFAIETGISGLNQYLSAQRYEENFGEVSKTPLGRSEGGIEIQVPLAAGGYVPRKYMSSLLNFLDSALRGQ